VRRIFSIRIEVESNRAAKAKLLDLQLRVLSLTGRHFANR